MNIDLETDGFGSLQARFEDLEESGTTDREYEVGSAGVEYARYLEFGTRKMPPYPWFRPAIREAQANPEAFVDGVDEIQSIAQYLRDLSASLEAQMKVNVTATTGGRSPGVHPEHPKVQTGTLRSSIRSRRVR